MKTITKGYTLLIDLTRVRFNYKCVYATFDCCRRCRIRLRNAYYERKRKREGEREKKIVKMLQTPNKNSVTSVCVCEREKSTVEKMLNRNLTVKQKTEYATKIWFKRTMTDAC